MWNPSQHTDDENVRWSWLRAVEWIGWPLFLSQPVVPVLLYFLYWPLVLGALLVVVFLWRAFVVPFWVAPVLASAGVYFVKLKFVTAPLMAYLLWAARGDMAIAAAALLWPFLGTLIVQAILIIPEALLAQTWLGKASQIGAVQTRFLLAMGLRPREAATVLTEE